MLLHSQTCFLFLWVLRGFTSPGSQSNLKLDSSRITRMGFPHSEISGSKIVRHLPEAYRSRTTSFIAILCQGIHHTLLNFPLGNLKTTSLTFFVKIFITIFFYPYSIDLVVKKLSYFLKKKSRFARPSARPNWGIA